VASGNGKTTVKNKMSRKLAGEINLYLNEGERVFLNLVNIAIRMTLKLGS
jgi:hypothetical protein